jgi:hypothetical protein
MRAGGNHAVRAWVPWSGAGDEAGERGDVEIGERADHQVGGAEVEGARHRPGHGDDDHAGGATGGHPVGRVLEHDAARRVGARLLGGDQEQVGGRLGARRVVVDVVARDDGVEPVGEDLGFDVV